MGARKVELRNEESGARKVGLRKVGRKSGAKKWAREVERGKWGEKSGTRILRKEGATNVGRD